MAYLNASAAKKTGEDTLEILASQLLNVSPHSPNLAQVMNDLLAELGQQWQCDRIFLYLRSPRSTLGRVPFCWRVQPTVPLAYDLDWKLEPAALTKDDPMFAAALNVQPSIFVEDVETASPEVLNRDFERETFGHRALIHAHLCSDQKLWGVLQPCVFSQLRDWSRSDRHLTEQAASWLTPFAVDYVNAHAP